MPRRATTTGGILKNLRIERGLTQEELAAGVGISRPHVSNLENNRSKPSNGTLSGIAKVLRLKPDILMNMVTAGSGRGARRGPMRPRTRPYHY